MCVLVKHSLRRWLRRPRTIAPASSSSTTIKAMLPYDHLQTLKLVRDNDLSTFIILCIAALFLR